MRWLVGIALLGATGIGTASAQTQSADPSVTVDLSAIPSREQPRVYTGERVVFPLIYPDGSMANARRRPSVPAETQNVTLTPPDGVSTSSTPPQLVSPAPPQPSSAAPANSAAPTPPQTEEAALAPDTAAASTPTPPANTASGIPSPTPKPKSVANSAAPETAAATTTAPAPTTDARVGLFSEPPAKGEEQREAKTATQLAAISPEIAKTPATPQVLFLAGGTDLDGAGMAVLDAMALQLAKTKERVELQAFASTSPTQSDSAKRLSLRRALAVRTYLIGKGIDADRIIMKAKGDATEGAPERVDIVRSAG